MVATLTRSASRRPPRRISSASRRSQAVQSTARTPCVGQRRPQRLRLGVRGRGQRGQVGEHRLGRLDAVALVGADHPGRAAFDPAGDVGARAPARRRAPRGRPRWAPCPSPRRTAGRGSAARRSRSRARRGRRRASWSPRCRARGRRRSTLRSISMPLTRPSVPRIRTGRAQEVQVDAARLAGAARSRVHLVSEARHCRIRRSSGSGTPAASSPSSCTITSAFARSPIWLSSAGVNFTCWGPRRTMMWMSRTALVPQRVEHRLGHVGERPSRRRLRASTRATSSATLPAPTTATPGWSSGGVEVGEVGVPGVPAHERARSRASPRGPPRARPARGRPSCRWRG